MFMSSTGPGSTMGFPDVCKTPMPPVGAPVPMPYPNTTETTMTLPPTTSMMVLADMMPSCNISSEVPMSEGDEPGVMMGIVSNLGMGPQKYVVGSVAVLIEAMPAQRLTSVTSHNGMMPNAPGTMLVPSQTFVLCNA